MREKKKGEKGLFTGWLFYKPIFETGMILGLLHAHNYALEGLLTWCKFMYSIFVV